MSRFLSPQSLCIIHRKALCTVVQNSGGDVIVAVSIAPDCHLGWIHATGENARLFCFVGVANSRWPRIGHEVHQLTYLFCAVLNTGKHKSETWNPPTMSLGFTNVKMLKEKEDVSRWSLKSTSLFDVALIFRMLYDKTFQIKIALKQQKLIKVPLNIISQLFFFEVILPPSSGQRVIQTTTCTSWSFCNVDMIYFIFTVYPIFLILWF